MFGRSLGSMVSLVLCAVVCVGCVESEAEEYRVILGADGLPARVIVTQHNLSSDEVSPEKVKADFEELLADVDDPCLLAAEDGAEFIPLDREVYVEGGVLNLRTTVSVTDEGRRAIARAFSVRENGEHVLSGQDLSRLVHTDGRIVETEEGPIIVWSADAREFTLRFRSSDPTGEVFDRNSKLLAEWHAETKARG